MYNVKDLLREMSSLPSTIIVLTFKAFDIPKLDLTHSNIAHCHASQREEVGEEEEEEIVAENARFNPGFDKVST